MLHSCHVDHVQDHAYDLKVKNTLNYDYRTSQCDYTMYMYVMLNIIDFYATEHLICAFPILAIIKLTISCSIYINRQTSKAQKMSYSLATVLYFSSASTFALQIK